MSKDFCTIITKKTNTTEIIDKFIFNHYDRMIIVNDFTAVINGVRIYYYMIVEKLRPADRPESVITEGIYYSGLKVGITISKLKRENFLSAQSYCEEEIRKFGAINKQTIEFEKPFIFRAQDSAIQENYSWEDYKYGDTNQFGIYGVQIIDVGNTKNNNPTTPKVIKKDEPIIPRVKRTNLYYSIIFNNEEYKIYFDEAKNVNDAIRIFNQRYKAEHSQSMNIGKKKTGITYE